MKKRSGRRFWLIAGTLFLAGAAIAAFLYLTREPLLMERAVKVADTRDWDFRWTSYQWIDDRQVLFFRESSPQYPVPHGWNFFKRDIVRNRDEHLSALTRLAQNYGGKHSETAVSPDGKRIYWTGEEGYLFYSSTLDGKQFRKFNRGRDSRIAWTGDSAHLVEYVMDADLDHVAYGLVHDVTGSTPKRKLVKPGISPLAEDEISVSATNHILTTSWTGKDDSESETDTVDVFESVIGQENLPTRSSVVHLPVKAEIWGEQFSPQGDRILWRLVQEALPLRPPLSWLHRLLPSLVPEPTSRMSLWVSRLDGSQMHEVGYVPVGPAEFGMNLNDIPERFCWLPDGKRISFLHNDALFIVPAD